MEPKRFKKGTVIFRQGEITAYMYDVISGRIGIYAGYGTEEREELAIFGPGDTFGEMEFIEGCPRIASAVALEDCEVYELDRDAFSAYFQDKPEKVLSVMRQLSRRVRETTEDYLEACRTVYEKEHPDQAGEDRGAELDEKLSFFRKIGRLLGR